MGLISPEIIENVRVSTDIVQLIGEYVRLQKKGKNYVGNCPFHQERDPSFTVTPDKQIFYCFGCHAGGNAFKFLMLFEKLSFQEAVRRLASRAGIQLPETDSPRDRKKAARDEWAWKANALAAEYYHYILLNRPEGAVARDYLRGRGISDDIIKIFKLGFAPQGWENLLRFMKGKGYQPGELVELGLAMAGERGANRDRFRRRVMFPVNDALGRTRGFGGRILEAGQPKYLNSPETPYFDKGSILYGLDQARAAIRKKNQAVIMEGYLDVISAHQHGITNAVASLGTSLTPEQGKLLLRYTNRALFAYDSDRAGISATLRGLDVLQELGFSLGVITIPDGKDPDEFLRRHGAADWEELIISAEPLLEFKLGFLLREGKSRLEALADVLKNLANISRRAEQDEGIQLVSSRLGMSWDAVKEELESFKEHQGKIWPKPDKIAKNKHNIIKSEKIVDPVIVAERGILHLLLEDQNRIDYVVSVLGNDFWSEPLHREIFRMVVRHREQGGFEPARAMNELDEVAVMLVNRLLFEKIPGDDPDRIMEDYITAVNKNLINIKRTKLIQDLAEAEKTGDQDRMNQLMQQIQNLR
ncbi:DNA primase [Desulfocucumis palustris]|uniref:DNA primase n=1 Tax=Desulfocucumis palustris TaxID=1898651 RepID=A0A2L2XC63_9FIRM|nr:DNA primase [Desulfocucumis palustris]GBF33730.1 DNA primase [Desulfocucumis palustris]